MEYIGNDIIQKTEFKPIENDNENIMKNVLKEGSGVLTPNNQAKVRVHLICRLINGENDKIIEDTIKFKQQRVYKVWSEGKRRFMVDGLNDGVMTMKKGEVALFKINGKASGFGDSPVIMDLEDANKTMKEMSAKVGNNDNNNEMGESAQLLQNDSTWYFYLELIDFELNLKQVPRSYDECVFMASQIKELGNKAFKNKKYQRAIDYYEQMEEVLHHHDNFGKGKDKRRWVDNLPEKKKTIFELRQTMCLNNAMAMLKDNPGNLARAKRVVHLCNRVLKKDKQNIKALYRKAKALRFLGDLDRAEELLNTVSNLQDEEDKSLQQEKRRLKKAQEQAKRKTDSVFQQVWGGINSGKGLYDDVEPYDEEKDWDNWIKKNNEQGKKVWFGCDGSVFTAPTQS